MGRRRSKASQKRQPFRPKPATWTRLELLREIAAGYVRVIPLEEKPGATERGGA